MPLNTRSKKREPIESIVEFSVHNLADQTVGLNLPKAAITLEPNKVVKSTLFDISASGCAISSSYVIPPGVILDIKIDSTPFNIQGALERKEPFLFSGKVKSCIMKAAGQYRLGIKFQNPEKADSDFISSFISIRERRRDPRWDMTKKE